jgi:hypothetical protein
MTFSFDRPFSMSVPRRAFFKVLRFGFVFGVQGFRVYDVV